MKPRATNEERRVAVGPLLVTGASGFIGSRLCDRLVDAGVEVHAVSRHPQPSASGVRWWRVDLAEAHEVDELLRQVRPRTIFHLASHVLGTPAAEQIVPALRANLFGTVNLLLAAMHGNCERIVLTGTMMEPSDGGVPNSPYAAAKWAASGYARMFHALYGTPVVNLRLFMVYGPGQSDPRKIIPHTILSFLRGEAPELSSGLWDVDLVYVDDVVDALLAAATDDGVEGATFDIASGNLVSLRTVVLHLAELVGGDVVPRFGVLPDRPFERPIVADLNRSQQVLGWQPRVSIEDGLQRTVDWFRERVEIGASLPQE